jgi:hypothetical protein
MKMRFLVYLALPLVLISSCSKDDDSEPSNNNNEPDCTTFNVTYDKDIKGIIDGNCAIPICHGGNSSLPDFRTYDGIFAKRSGAQSRVVSKTMPPAGRTALSQSDIDKFNCWVKNGAPQ